MTTPAILKTQEPESVMRHKVDLDGQEIEVAPPKDPVEGIQDEQAGENGANQGDPAESGAEGPTETQAKILSKPEPQESDEFSKKFSALSKRERYLSQKEKQLRDDLKDYDELKRFRDQYEQDPYKLLESQGHTLEDWTKKILNDGNSEPIDEIKTIKQELEAIKSEKQQQHDQAIQAQRVQKMQAELGNIDQKIREAQEEFPLVNLFGDQQLIFDIRATKFNQDAEAYGQEYAMENLMGYPEAIQMAEDYRKDYINQNKESLKGLTSIIKTLESSEAEQPPAQENQEIPPQQAEAPPTQSQAPDFHLPEKTQRLLGLKTLTNDAQTTVPGRDDSMNFRSESDRLRAIADKYL